MAHLLQIDSSVRGAQSVTRALTARAARAWRAAHPAGTIAYRDLAAEPIPHLTELTGHSRMIPPDLHTAAQAESWALSEKLIREIGVADTLILGMPLYNFGPPSALKAWVDHIVAPELSIDTATRDGLLGGRELIVVAALGGDYRPGTPRVGWDHARPWLAHALNPTGLEPRFITAELTLAEFTPELTELQPLAAQSLAAAEAEIDELWLGSGSWTA